MFNTSRLSSTLNDVQIPASPDKAIAASLLVAAFAFDKRTDAFATGKGDTCRDMASKVERYGSFASDKQRGYAEKLIEWSKPRTAFTPSTDWGRPTPKLFAVMQEHTHFYADPLKLSRRNQDSLVWIMYNGQCVGKIEDGRAQVWTRKAVSAGTTSLAVLAVIEEFEADPLAAAKKYGKLSGRCCSCGRDLTDPVSIEAGIGPICATRFN